MTVYLPVGELLQLIRDRAIVTHGRGLEEEPHVEKEAPSSCGSLMPPREKELPMTIRPMLVYACRRAARNHGWLADVNMLAKELYRALFCKALCYSDLDASLPFRLDMCWHE